MGVVVGGLFRDEKAGATLDKVTRLNLVFSEHKFRGREQEARVLSGGKASWSKVKFQRGWVEGSEIGRERMKPQGWREKVLGDMVRSQRVKDPWVRSLEIHIHSDILYCLIIIYWIFHTHGLCHPQVPLPLSKTWGHVLDQSFCWHSFLKNFIGVQLMHYVALVFGVQQSESVIHTHTSFLL